MERCVVNVRTCHLAKNSVKVGETWLQLNVVKLLLLSGTTSEMLLFFQLMFFLTSPPDRFPAFIISKM